MNKNKNNPSTSSTEKSGTPDVEGVKNSSNTTSSPVKAPTMEGATIVSPVQETIPIVSQPSEQLHGNSTTITPHKTLKRTSTKEDWRLDNFDKFTVFIATVDKCINILSAHKDYTMEAWYMLWKDCLEDDLLLLTISI